MVMELIRATSPELGGFSFLWQDSPEACRPKGNNYSALSPTNHCSLFLKRTLKVVNDP